MDNYFNLLNGINVSGKTEKKNGLTYLSWAWAWGEVKKLFPDATYTIYEDEAGWFYHTDGRTAWVKTGVTVNGIEHIEYLPVMDYKNRSIPLDAITSFDVNKAIQRSLTKAVARHGLGLYIYAGEDLPEDDKPKDDKPKGDKPKGEKPKEAQQEEETYHCRECGDALVWTLTKEGKQMSPTDIRNLSFQRYGRVLCPRCMKNEDAKKSEE